MFNIGSGEIMLIAIVALLVLGPKRLPEFARGIGKFIREFRRQTDGVRDVVEREFYRMDQDLSSELPPPVVQPPTDGSVVPQDGLLDETSAHHDESSHHHDGELPPPQTEPSQLTAGAPGPAVEQPVTTSPAPESSAPAEPPSKE